MRARFVLCLLTALGTTVLAATPALAQSANEVAAARRLYQQGVRHARAHDWDEALDAFRRSLALAERPATLVNMAGALVETGRLVEGAETYRRYLTVDADGRYAESARQLLSELEARMPKLRLRVAGLGDDDAILLDDQDLGHAALNIELPIDPGEHRVSVTRDGNAVGEETFSVAERESRQLEMRVPPPAPRVDLTVTDDEAMRDEDAESSGGVLSSPVFWLVVAVLATGGVAAALLLGSGDSGPDAFEGNVGAGRVGL